MRKGIIFLFLFGVLFFLNAHLLIGQTQYNPVFHGQHLFIFETEDTYQSADNSVQSAIQNGSSQNLAKHFFETVDITLPTTQGSYSKSQAEQLIRTFFQSNPPKQFTISNEGSSNNERTKFIIGVFYSDNGKSFRTYVMRKEINQKSYITILKFE